jgi:hypothetical protein
MTARKQESATRLVGSDRAKLHAAVILEVLAGVRGTQEASEAMGVSPNRYYQLEARALSGMLQALEPLPRGRKTGPEAEMAKLQTENQRLSREVTRLTSLVRVARRSLGIEMTAKRKEKATPRGRKPSHRGKKVVALLRKPKDDGSPDEAKAS